MDTWVTIRPPVQLRAFQEAATEGRTLSWGHRRGFLRHTWYLVRVINALKPRRATT